MSAHLLPAGTGLVAGLLAAPYLARLTLSVPDRHRREKWRGQPAGRRRVGTTGMIAALLGALAGAAAGWGPVLPAFLLLALAGAALLVIDYEHHRLPNRLVEVLAGGAIVLLALAAALGTDTGWTGWLRACEGAAAVFAALFLLAVLAPGGFGFGDVKLGAVLGGYLGWYGWAEVYYGILAGFLLGALVAAGLLASGRASRKTAIAFGPTLIIGPLLVLAFDLVP